MLFQCGADSLAGDPITHLKYSERGGARPCGPSACASIAEKQGHGRVFGT